MIWTEEGTHSVINRRRKAPIQAFTYNGDYHWEDFPYFAERLSIIEHYLLKEVRIGGLRQLLQDSRDQMQYYTFLVAITVLGLTLVGLVLSTLQTIASFMQVSLAMKQLDKND